ncbi:MAG: flagellar assembly protein FliW [Fibrobacterota bacterium]
MTEETEQTTGKEYLASDIITFRDGLPGFPDRRQFIIVREEDIAPFEWMINVDDDTDLRFAVVNPFYIYPDYTPEVPDFQVKDLAVSDASDLTVYAIATIHDDFKKTTVNLSGPVVINVTRRLAKQVILDTDKYSTKEPVLRD